MRRTLLAVCVVLLGIARPAMSAPTPPTAAQWKAIDKLVEEQKLQEAETLAEKLLSQARDSNSDEAWTKAIITVVQLKSGLHGYESSVRFLKDQPWPKAPLSRVALNLYYAQSLVAYLDSYSWEIGQRERVDAGQTVDLKAMTVDQIYGAALAAYDDIWKIRADLGKQPVAALKDYIVPNSYPENIRPSLRDAVTYLATQLLANSSYWRPEESNALEGLDAKALMNEPPAASLADGSVHPLRRLAGALGDLARWHADEDKDGAALEAYLERARLLNQALSDIDQRTVIRKTLEERLDDSRKEPWWAMGMADLASMTRDTGDAVKALAFAKAGQKAYPKALGGLRCAGLVAEIEAPSFSLQAMTVDGASKRSVAVESRNLEKLYFRAFPLDLLDSIAKAKNSDLFPDYEEMRALLKKKPALAWEEKIEQTGDYQTHTTYVTPLLRKPGLYAILASARDDFSAGNNEVYGVRLVISGLSLVSRTLPGKGFDVTVVDGETGKPVPGAEVRLYRADYNVGHKLEVTSTTDARGMATVEKKVTSGYPSYFILAKKGDDVTLDSSFQYLGGREHTGRQKPASSSLIYTDRSVYRPGQSIHWKVVAYEATNPSVFKTKPKQALKMVLKDANNKVVLEQKVTTNDFGSASGTMSIPTGRLLGRWRLESDWGHAQSQVLVEEYKRPTFEVSLKDAEAPLRLNQAATLQGEARYYFGLPVAAGSVRWKVSREPVYPWWWWFWFSSRSDGRVQTVASGTSKLSDEGKFTVDFRPEAVEKAENKDVTYRYKVEVDLTDEGGETRSATKSYRIGFVAIEATISSDDEFLSAGKTSELSIKRTSLDGAARAGTASYRILALKQPEKVVAPADLPMPKLENDGKRKSTKGDLLRPRWSPDYSPESEMSRWQDGEEQASGNLTHGKDGLAALKLPALKPGAYRVRYETTDEFGAKYQTWKDLIVVGNETPLNLPAVLMAEKTSVPVGGIAKLFVKGAAKGQTLYFEIFREGKTRERRLVTAKDSDVVEIPVTEADRGGFGVALMTVLDHQLIYLTRQVYVPWDNKELSVSFETFRDKLTPGATETFKVRIRGPKASTGAAEVLAYMYDRSLDFFAPHNVPSPLSLYPNLTHVPSMRLFAGPAGGMGLLDSGFEVNASWPEPVPDRLEMLNGYGIGGMGRSYGMKSMANESATLSLEPSAPGSGIRAKAAAPAPMADAAAPIDAESGQPVRFAQKSEAAKESAPASEPPADALRTNFNETAFFLPHLLTDKSGAVTFEFKVPDSVTSWNLWAVALTRDLSGGSATKETRTVKDLMVRPYLPRFFREGDAAELRVTVNNAADRELSGDLLFEIVDASTGASAAKLFGLGEANKTFRVKAGGGTTVSFPVTAPKQVGIWAFKVTAKSGNLQDGELRPLPVLPSRMHLAQSRFVTLKDKEARTMTFEDLTNGKDKSLVNDRLVVTVDGQLFYGALQALPYLATYPYECTEQTLNRFLSTGIMASVYKGFPSVAEMAKTFSKRSTPLAPWDLNDPNARMTLEESPWLVESQGGGAEDARLVKTLDPEVVQATRTTALASLRKAQLPNGGFPWFQGGPASPYITLYLLHGFAKATEFGIDVPKDMVVKASKYLAKNFRDNLVPHMKKAECCWEELTFLGYVASAFPDPSWTAGALTAKERQEMLDYSFKHWKKHSPYLKAYLALTLKRADRIKDAKLVFDSVMDSAKTEKDLGTYWAPEDRAWLWYNDTIETHAFALRTLMELSPGDKRIDGLVQWLFLNKKLNHWKSTRATAEVIYSLVHYMKKTGTLGIKEAVDVAAGDAKRTFTFEPNVYKGKAQLVVPGPDVKPTTGNVTVAKETKGLMFASATWHFSTEEPPAEARGDFFNVTRNYFRRDGKGSETTLKPLAAGDKVQVGDQVEVHISLRTKHAGEYIHLRDPRPAGFEPESTTSRFKWDLGIGWYEEVRDSGANFFFERLPVGEYTFKYRLRATTAGTFLTGPATVQSMYAPEFAAYSAATRMTITP